MALGLLALLSYRCSARLLALSASLALLTQSCLLCRATALLTLLSWLCFCPSGPVLLTLPCWLGCAEPALLALPGSQLANLPDHSRFSLNRNDED